MFEFQFITILLLFLPYAVAIVLPTWRSLFGYIITLGGLLVVQSVAIVTAKTSTGLEALGFLFVLPPAVSLAVGAPIRAASLVVAARTGRRAYVFAIHAGGFVILLGILTGAIVWAKR
jgi:hypothetical protein